MCGVSRNVCIWRSRLPPLYPLGCFTYTPLFLRFYSNWQEKRMAYNNQNKGGSSSNEKSSESSLPPGFRSLGESGLVEDEDGNVYSASDFLDPSEREQLADVANSFFPPADDSSTPKMPDWAAIYDPRYCGPSREAYIEEMTRQYQLRQAGMMQPDSVSEQLPADESVSTPKSAPSATSFPHEQTSTPDEESSSPVPGPSSPDENPFSPAVESSSPDEEPSFSEEGSSTPETEYPSPDNAGVESENRPLFHISRKALVFYIIGAILLLVYFCFLIYRLISLAIHLFEI